MYLPDVYHELKQRDLPASELLQVAVRAEVERRKRPLRRRTNTLPSWPMKSVSRAPACNRTRKRLCDAYVAARSVRLDSRCSFLSSVA